MFYSRILRKKVDYVIKLIYNLVECCKIVYYYYDLYFWSQTRSWSVWWSAPSIEIMFFALGQWLKNYLIVQVFFIRKPIYIAQYVFYVLCVIVCCILSLITDRNSKKKLKGRDWNSFRWRKSSECGVRIWITIEKWYVKHCSERWSIYIYISYLFLHL